MKKVIRLTESDLARIVKRVLNEQPLTPKVDDRFLTASPEERENELKKQDAEIKRLEMELKQIRNEISQARIENIKEAKTKFVSKMKQIIANIDETIEYNKINKKGSEIRHLEEKKTRLEDKLRRIETGEDRTPEQKKQIMDTLKEVAFGLGVYMSGLFAFLKAREKNPDKFREYGL